jgi:hypothetical protein
MCVLIFAGALGLLAWANVALVRLYLRRRAGWGWWVALSAAWLTGGALGVWGGFFFEYQPTPTLRVIGAPVPAAFHHWEGPPGEEQWVDFITPAPALYAASNIALLGLLAGCPVGLVFLVFCLADWLQCGAKPPDPPAGPHPGALDHVPAGAAPSKRPAPCYDDRIAPQEPPCRRPPNRPTPS